MALNISTGIFYKTLQKCRDNAKFRACTLSTMMCERVWQSWIKLKTEILHSTTESCVAYSVNSKYYTLQQRVVLHTVLIISWISEG